MSCVHCFMFLCKETDSTFNQVMPQRERMMVLLRECKSGNAVSAAEKCKHKIVTLISMSKEVSGDCEAVAFE